MAAVSFSSDGADVIERKTSGRRGRQRSDSDVRDFYELERCVTWVKNGKFKRVALQFPDELLCDSTNVAKCIEKSTAASIFILGDTSYGSCCVDEVAAQHYDADSIIHFGRSCLSPTERLPVLLVFGKSSIDMEDCVEKVTEQFRDVNSQLILLFDVMYHHSIGAITERLRKKFPNLLCSKLQMSDDHNALGEKAEEAEKGDKSTSVCCCRRIINIPKESKLEDYVLLFIGNEGLTLTNLMMNFNKCVFFTYNPQQMYVRKETLNVNKALMKRFYMIERAKDAGIVGIVVGTLGVAEYLSAINRLKLLIKKAGKKSYTFVVGKLNVAKLANFMEVDIFVLVSCMECSLIDSSEFYKPVVTPFEMEIACNSARDWTGDYITDFRDLLPGASSHVEIPDEISEEFRTDVSLVTGKLRHYGINENQPLDENSTAVLPRDATLTVSVTTETAGDFLSGREWQGLERKLGETPVLKAVQGQKGIAAGYTNEQQPS